MTHGENGEAGRSDETSVAPVPFDNDGWAFLLAVQERGRELTEQGDPDSYYRALREAAEKLPESGYMPGQIRGIVNIGSLSLVTREYGGPKLLAMMLEDILEPPDPA